MPKTSIRQRIKAIAAGQSPDIPPPPEREEEIPSIDTLIPDRKIRIELARLVAKKGDIGLEISELRKAEKPIVVAIKKLVGTYQIGRALAGEWRINYFSTQKYTLSVEKLLKAGVSQALIDKCYEQKTSYTLKITKDAGDEEAEEEE